MAIDVEQLRSGGVLPSGPVSAWPQERNNELIKKEKAKTKGAQSVNVGAMRMARNLAQTAKQAVTHGKVSEEIREERYETCKACPFFIEDSKRCSECGCFMEAKTWVGGNPNTLCPKKKWSR